MKILLLSAYDAASHRYWRCALEEELHEVQWTQLALPARHFSWRIRGNPLSWLQQREIHARYDLVLATSMVDLATLKGLVPALAATPSVLYFHENQFSYPASKHQKHQLEPQMVSLYASLAADRLAFNSDYNRETFLDGVTQLLQKLPDHTPEGIAALLRAKSEVLPVPIALSAAPTPPRSTTGVFELLWNHRWEYDKGPEQLLAALQRLPAQLPLRVHVVGQQFRQQPSAFDAIKALLDRRGWLGEWGFLIAPAAYQTLLQRCHAVLSTSLHDFQGLAVLLAVAAGCWPIVPDRLAYREIFPDACRYRAYCAVQGEIEPRDIAAEASACAEAIATSVVAWQRQQLPAAPSVEALTWPSLQASYRSLIESTAAIGTRPPSTGTIPLHSN